MTNAKKIVASALAASLAMGIVTPASAAAWNAPGQLQQQINQLDKQIERAEARRTISHREAQSLDRQVNQLQATFRSYARGGFTRYELASLDSRINAVQRQIKVERRDNDRYADAGRYNRYNPRHR